MIRSDFTLQEYTEQDFLRLIEQRIRKEIRQGDLISLKKSYQLSETQSLQSQVLLYFLQQIFHNRLVLDSGELIHTDFLEQYITSRVDIFLGAKETDTLFEKSLCPLRSITQHEIQEVAKILSLQGTFSPVSHELIDELHTKYPQSKPSFLKSFAHLETFTKK